ncbi:flagellar basal body rod protein FlgC [Niallia taxi]|uniref:flagellar basal body rod protein FlgC n=1 Tax=Niallia taxi TaxID=2499688 RepID=UPI0015F64AAA|nr:flagellar basal body rod protein FlgC [Niallia taxi]
MSLFSNINASASALTANRLRMDVAASNIANANTTRGKMVNGEWVPYSRKMVELTPKGASTFDNLLQKAMGNGVSSTEGVVVSKIKEDRTPFKLMYDPTHPDADANGYVKMPNVDLLKENVDLMSATRSYEANVTALNASKSMYMKALEIGK